MDWLQEFPAQVDLNKNPELEKAYPDVKKEGGYFLPRIAWDMVPGYWTEHEAYMDKKYMERNRSGEKFRSRRSIRSCD